MLGESLTTVTLGEKGIEGDRAWATRDEVRGGIRGAKKLPQLMSFQATSVSGNTAEITAPDGETCQTNTDAINGWLSEKLSHDVTLWPIMPADNLDHYRRGAPDSENFTALSEVTEADVIAWAQANHPVDHMQEIIIKNINEQKTPKNIDVSEMPWAE